jgi:hypothetical protein
MNKHEEARSTNCNKTLPFLLYNKIPAFTMLYKIVSLMIFRFSCEPGMTNTAFWDVTAYISVGTNFRQLRVEEQVKDVRTVDARVADRVAVQPREYYILYVSDTIATPRTGSSWQLGQAKVPRRSICWYYWKAVAHLVHALCNKPEDRGFDSLWGQWIFQFT